MLICMSRAQKFTKLPLGASVTGYCCRSVRRSCIDMAFVNHSNQWNQGHKSLLVSEGNIDRQQYRVTEAPSGSLVNF